MQASLLAMLRSYWPIRVNCLTTSQFLQYIDANSELGFELQFYHDRILSRSYNKKRCIIYRKLSQLQGSDDSYREGL